jgi:acetyl-CoA C-acetyltransferase
MKAEAMIVAGARTPIGSLGGALSTVPAVDLGAACIKAVLEKSKVPADEIDEVIMGNVVAAGLGQNPARQASIKAGLPVKAGATTINKVCGSGLKAVMLAADGIQLGNARVVVAGGMESMSQAPFLLPHARQGYRMGDDVVWDSMIHDGLWDVYTNKHMGTFGDQCAAKCGFDKNAQDDFAVRSFTRARRAVAEGVFDDEVVPVVFKGKKEGLTVTEDEGPARFNEDKLRGLRPAFGATGTVTAGNASSINDGAAALLVASDAQCTKLRLRPIARIVGAATFSREPEWFTLAPIGAMRRLLDKINWKEKEVDLFEINEAFACVTMAAEKELELQATKVNIYGGAVALGHPIGASGARVLVTLLTGLKRTGGHRGVACLCIGGGEAVAMAIERLDNE